MASTSNSVYGDRVFTDKQPFNFPGRALAFAAWIRAGAHCCHLTWAEGSLGCGWAEMGLRGPLSVGAGYFMYLNTSFGAAEEAAMLESRILYPKRKQQCLQFFYKMSGSPSDRLVVWIRRDDSTGNVRKLVKLKTFQGTWRRPAGTDWASHPGLCSLPSSPSPALFTLLPVSIPPHPPNLPLLCLLLLFLGLPSCLPNA